MGYNYSCDLRAARGRVDRIYSKTITSRSMAPLSDLHDDLLRRILHFTPAKEAATTSALARRWRWLWLSSAAVNLDSFSYSSGGQSSKDSAAAFLRGSRREPPRPYQEP